MDHKMDMATQNLGVERGGVEFKITGDGVSIGRLKVTNATIAWFPKNAKKCVSMSWERFDELMVGSVK